MDPGLEVLRKTKELGLTLNWGSQIREQVRTYPEPPSSFLWNPPALLKISKTQKHWLFYYEFSSKHLGTKDSLILKLFDFCWSRTGTSLGLLITLVYMVCDASFLQSLHIRFWYAHIHSTPLPVCIISISMYYTSICISFPWLHANVSLASLWLPLGSCQIDFTSGSPAFILICICKWSCEPNFTDNIKDC